MTLPLPVPFGVSTRTQPSLDVAVQGQWASVDTVTATSVWSGPSSKNVGSTEKVQPTGFWMVRNVCPFTVVVKVRVSSLVCSLTFRIGVALPVPEPGEMSAHPASVRADHSQLAGSEMVNWYRPNAEPTDVGIPVTVALQPGAGEGLGDGAGEGLVGLGLASDERSLEPEHAVAMSASMRTADRAKEARVIAQP